MITTPQLKTCWLESNCTLRTTESHFEQSCHLTGPLRDHYSTNYGITRLSKLKEVPGYSVIDGLPHDIMHDLFEGVVPYELKLLLCHCVHANYFTIQELNERILLKICSIAVSPLCLPDTVAYLRVLIEEKLALFQQLYPEKNVIPKQHYMLHYPSQIERLGPLIQSWIKTQLCKEGLPA